jgi:hypothetical protein
MRPPVNNAIYIEFAINKPPSQYLNYGNIITLLALANIAIEKTV